MTESLMDRIVFGTARLAGGAYARASARLLETCLRGGITRFDTAPSYGMGASEALLGKVTAGQHGIEIATKIGSAKPSHAGLRGWAKLFYRLSGFRREPSAPDYGQIRRHIGPGPAMNYQAEACRASFTRSLTLLRRERIDLLLLHEAEPADVPQETVELVKNLMAAGAIGSAGAAHQGPGGPLPDGWIRQIAPDIGDFTGSTMQAGPVRFHSVRTIAHAAARADHTVAMRLEAVAKLIGGGDPLGLAPIALLTACNPEAQVIYATTDQRRLAGFIAAWRSIDLAGIAENIR